MNICPIRTHTHAVALDKCAGVWQELNLILPSLLPVIVIVFVSHHYEGIWSVKGDKPTSRNMMMSLILLHRQERVKILHCLCKGYHCPYWVLLLGYLNIARPSQANDSAQQIITTHQIGSFHPVWSLNTRNDIMDVNFPGLECYSSWVFVQLQPTLSELCFVSEFSAR